MHSGLWELELSLDTSCFRKKSPRWFLRIDWWQKMSGELWEFNNHRGGYTIWFTGQVKGIVTGQPSSSLTPPSCRATYTSIQETNYRPRSSQKSGVFVTAELSLLPTFFFLPFFSPSHECMECDCCVLFVLTQDSCAICVHCYVCSNTAEQTELPIKNVLMVI